MVAPVVRFLSAAVPTTRSTSDFETSTPAIVAPATRRCRSRAIVSTSGSSGTARGLAPADVAAELLPIEVDRSRGREAASLRLREVTGNASHGDHASAGRDESAAGIAGGTRMED